MSRGVFASLVVKSRRIFHHHEDYRSVCFRLPSFDRDRRALYSRQRMNSTLCHISYSGERSLDQLDENLNISFKISEWNRSNKIARSYYVNRIQAKRENQELIVFLFSFVFCFFFSLSQTKNVTGQTAVHVEKTSGLRASKQQMARDLCSLRPSNVIYPPTERDLSIELK